ncbi:MAG: hypothetical protein ACOY4D_05700 [Pseudomonadota bacterium]
MNIPLRMPFFLNRQGALRAGSGFAPAPGADATVTPTLTRYPDQLLLERHLFTHTARLKSRDRRLWLFWALIIFGPPVCALLV